jgi:hypothetical protein
MRDDQHELPTPRTTLAARYVRVVLTCWSCRHQRDADLQALVDAGRGDVPLIHLRWRCSQCGSARIDMICTSHARVQPAPGQSPGGSGARRIV